MFESVIETVTTWLEKTIPGITTLTVTSIPFLIGVAVFSILMCIFGYRLFRVLIGLWAAVLGAFVGMQIASMFTDTWWIWLIAGAVLICLAAIFLYYVSAFLTIGVPVAILTAGLLATWVPQMEALFVCLIAIAAGVLFGLLTAFLQKPIIIICTSICGAFGSVAALWMLAATVFNLTETVEKAFGNNSTGIVQYIATGVLALIGLITQFATTVGYNRDK